MIKKTYDVVSHLIKRLFACFGMLTLIFAIVGRVSNTSEYSKYISVELILSFFAFACLFAVAFAVCDFIKNNSILRRFFQFVLTYAGFVLVFFIGGAFDNYISANSVQNKGFSILAISFVFIIIYVLCGLVSLIFGFIKNKVHNSNKQYDNMF